LAKKKMPLTSAANIKSLTFRLFILFLTKFFNLKFQTEKFGCFFDCKDDRRVSAKFHYPNG
jgi:hypothetical protein